MIVNAGIEAKDYQKTMSLIKEQLEDIQNGNLSDNDIQIAKIMLQNALRKTNDEAGSMIALAYNRDITHKQETNDEYIQKLLNVSKEDIINVAKKVQLDTISVSYTHLMFASLLALSMILVGCGGNDDGDKKDDSKKNTIVMITDKGTIEDKSFNQGTWEGIKAYGTETGCLLYTS